MNGISLNKLIAYNTVAAISPNDVVDIRVKRADKYGMYSVVIPNDSCVVLIANNLNEVKDYLGKIAEAKDIEKVNTNIAELPAAYRNISAYVTYTFGRKDLPILVYNIGNGKWPAVNGRMDVREYIKCLM